MSSYDNIETCAKYVLPSLTLWPGAPPSASLWSLLPASALLAVREVEGHLCAGGGRELNHREVCIIWDNEVLQPENWKYRYIKHV